MRASYAGLHLTVIVIAVWATSVNDLPAADGAMAATPTIAWNVESGQAAVRSGRLELTIETKSGINARLLRDAKTGRVYADGDYFWPNRQFPKLNEKPIVTELPKGRRSISLKGRLGDLEVVQKFVVQDGDPDAIQEEITICNSTRNTIATADFACGFAKKLCVGAAWNTDAALRLCHVPYRHGLDGKTQEWPLREVAEHGMAYPVGHGHVHQTRTWGAEGWLWTDGTTTLLMSKYNANGMEWSLLDPQKRSDEILVRFGGAGLWRPGLPLRPQDASPPECKHGLPAAAASLEPGQSYTFGIARLQILDGDWKPAYYAFRKYTESLGCRPERNYNPPIHWNELYDNEYFFKVAPNYDVDQESQRAAMKKVMQQFYTLDHMKAEAAKAKELGCESLYLDPGWDFPACSFLWDSSRLGTCDSFVKLMREQYGLKVSVWCGLGGVPPTWADPASCPVEAQVTTKEGKRNQVLCFPNAAFLDSREKNLLELARQGIAFFMFDSTQYSGPCYDKSHGHHVPSTRDEHANAIYELARRIEQKYPTMLIESHDPMTGPGSGNYSPTYINFAKPNSFNCLWGHEFMWNSMDDVLSGRAVSLYYYNMAYSIPLYLHVSLKPDNANAIVFWWFASTCRHLGMGGKHSDPAVWEAHKKAMRAYLPLKRFYTQGVFYGLDESLHAHTLPDLAESVVNAFNLTQQPATKQVAFRLAEIGLPPGKAQVDGVGFEQNGDILTVNLVIPARGHQCFRVKSIAGKQ